MSKAVQPLVKMEQYGTVNEAIIDLFYKEAGELNTFMQWKEKGFCVKNGSKAYVVWGSPRRIKSKDAEEGEEGTEFFPVCYLFSINQVQELNTTKLYSYAITN